MFSNYLSSIEGIEIYPIISLIIFFTFFIGLCYWVIRVDKTYITKMENLPLEQNGSGLNNDLENNQRI